MADQGDGCDGKGEPAWTRECPYCGKTIDCRPYWNHVSSEHPEEYENSRTTWYPLYKDYASAGMDIGTILMVMAELFNSAAEQIESFLMLQSFEEANASGASKDEAFAHVAAAFGKDVDFVRATMGA